MSLIIRAKFRCMEITHHWNKWSSVKFLPVKRDGKDSENTRFWDASPSGELRLDYTASAHEIWHNPEGQRVVSDVLNVGDYYYLDLTPQVGESEDAWNLNSVTKTESGGNVTFYFNQYKNPGLRNVTLHLNLTQPGTLELFGSPGKPWAADLRWAEASDLE